jgi:hypothetical protein
VILVFEDMSRAFHMAINSDKKIPEGEYVMDNTSNINTPAQQEIQQTPKPEWYDFLINIIQYILNFNQMTYKTKKAPTL